jgi:tetratricopeptide (TPR) repeat protein
MSAAEVKQALKDAKLAIDAGNWVEVGVLTAQLLGLGPTNGQNQIDADAPLAECLLSSKAISKDLLPLYYQALVFRGMGCSNEAKTLDKSALAENVSDRAKKDIIKDANAKYHEAQSCYTRALLAQPAAPLAWQGLAELLNHLVSRNASAAACSPPAQPSKSAISKTATSSAAASASSTPSAFLNPTSFHHAHFESFLPSVGRYLDETSRARHVQLNSALFLVYYMLHHLSANAALPAGDEAKAKTDKANKLFNLKTRQITGLEEAQLVGLAANMSYQHNQALPTSGVTVDTEESKLKLSRLLERFLRHKVAAEVHLASAEPAADASAAGKGAKTGLNAKEKQLFQSAPSLALLTIDHLDVFLEGIAKCFLAPAVEVPAVSATTAKPTSSAPVASSSNAKASAPAKASTAASSKTTASTKATAAKTTAPVSKATSSASSSSAAAVTPVSPLLTSEAQFADLMKVVQVATTLETANFSLEKVLGELFAQVGPKATELANSSKRLFLQMLLWSTHAGQGQTRDTAMILETCLKMTGVLPSSITVALDSCKKSSPTRTAIAALTGVKASSLSNALNARTIFGSPFLATASWAAASPTFSFSPNASGFSLATTGHNTLTQLPLWPTFVSTTGASLINIQSTHPTEMASKLPWATIVRFHVRGHGYDGLNMFLQNSVDFSKTPENSLPPVPTLPSSRETHLVHPFVLMGRASIADIKSFNASSDEENGLFAFVPSSPAQSTLHMLTLSYFQRFPNDSLAYLMYLESTFSNWMRPKDENSRVSLITDLIVQKVSSISSQASTQLSHLMARFNAATKSSDSEASATAMFLKNAIFDTLDLIVVSAYLKSSVQLRQYEYKPAVQTVQDALKKLEMVKTTVDFRTVSYAFYTVQFHLTLGKAFYRLKQLPQAEEAFLNVISQEQWNVEARLGLSLVFSADTVFVAPNASGSDPHRYFNLIVALEHINKVLEYFPEHSWAKSLKSHLQALPFVYIQEQHQKANIQAILGKSDSASAADGRQQMWLGTLLSGLGEGIIDTSSVEAKESVAAPSPYGGPIIKDPKKTDYVSGTKAVTARLDEDSIFSRSLRTLAEHLLGASVHQNAKLESSSSESEANKNMPLGFSQAQSHELMRIAISSRDALKALVEVHPAWKWTQYFLGSVELALGNEVDAKQAFAEAKKENPFAQAFHGHLLAKAYVQHGTTRDLEQAVRSFAASMHQYAEFKQSVHWIFGIGRGDGVILLEAAIPLLHILLEQCSDMKGIQAGDSNDKDEKTQNSTLAYEQAMALLQTISLAGHKWASFKAATFQLRRGDLDASLASILGFLRFFPRHPDASILVIEIYRRQGKMAAALKACRKLLAVEGEARAQKSGLIHPATLYFISTLLNFKANLIPTAIAQAKLCLTHLNTASDVKNSQSISAVVPFAKLEVTTTFLLSRMLLAESARLYQEGRVHDAKIAIQSAATFGLSPALTAAVSDPASPISKFSLHKLAGNIAATQLLIDQTNSESSASASLLAIKSFNYALQDAIDDETSALLHRDLANLYFSKAQRDQLSVQAEGLKGSAETIKKAAQQLKTVLTTLDLAVEETKKCIFLLTPTPPSESTTSLNALLLQSWRTLGTILTYYLRTLTIVNKEKGLDIKISDLGLKHAPTKQSISNMYISSLSSLADTSKTAPEESTSSKAVIGDSEAPTHMSAAENSECGRLWADAGLFWLWSKAPLEMVQAALKKAKRHDPALLASWVLHALLLLTSGSRGSMVSKASAFGYERQSIHTVMAGLLLALQTEESSASSAHPFSLDLYSSDISLMLLSDDGAFEAHGAGSYGQTEFGTKSLPIVLLLLFAIRGLDASPSTSSASVEQKSWAKLELAADEAASAIQLSPAAFARSVYASSSRYARLHPWDHELVHLTQILQHSLGLETQKEKLPPASLVTQAQLSTKLTLNASKYTMESPVSWIYRPFQAVKVENSTSSPSNAALEGLHLLPVGIAISSIQSYHTHLVKSLNEAKTIGSGNFTPAHLASFAEAITRTTAEACPLVKTDNIPFQVAVIKTWLHLNFLVADAVMRPSASGSPRTAVHSESELLHSLGSILHSNAGSLNQLKTAIETVSLQNSEKDAVTQVQVLLTYAQWCLTYLTAKHLWKSTECAAFAGKSVKDESSCKAYSKLDSLLQEISLHPATSVANKHAKSNDGVPKQRILTNPPLHSAAHFLVASTMSATSATYPSSLGLAVPHFTDFLALVSGLATSILLDLNSPLAAILWSGLRPFNLKSTTPVIVRLMDTPTCELLQLQRAAESSLLETRLWHQQGASMVAVQQALNFTHAKMSQEEKVHWLQSNVPKGDAETQKDEESVASESNATSSDSASTQSSSKTSSQDSNPIESDIPQRTFHVAQRAALLKPWDNDSWVLLSHTLPQ